MAKKILSVTIDQDQIKGIVVEKAASACFAGQLIDLSSDNALREACRSSEEIYINDTFMSAFYVCELFQKLDKRNLTALLYQDALDRLNTQDDIHVKHSKIEDVQVDLQEQTRVAYIAVYDRDIQAIWDIFKVYAKKIKGISSFPSCLANATALFDSTDSDFIVTWIGPLQSTIIIASPRGDIKVTRTFPFITSTLDFTKPNDMAVISSKINKEIALTINFFKRSFREPEPQRLHLFGHRELSSIFAAYPLSPDEMECRFDLPGIPFKGYAEGELTENLHVLCSIFPPENFIFFPRQVLTEKKINKVYYPLCILLMICIGGLSLWVISLNRQMAAANSNLLAKVREHQIIWNDVDNLEKRNGKWRPFQGWKDFYDLTFNDNPSWNKIVSDLGALTPKTIVLDSMKIARNPKAANKWLVAIEGEVQASTWQDGLREFREYGKRIQSSLFFSPVIDLKYIPQDVEEHSNFFKFNMLLNLKTMAGVDD